MRNELLLLASIVVLYGGILFCYRFFGKSGLYAYTAATTILANIEVMILVQAFGMEQTLGNVLFATSFVITDILSENEGKKEADRAVFAGISISVLFLLVTQSWRLFVPAASDTAWALLDALFVRTPRMLAASLCVYIIVQYLDVFLYHTIWRASTKKTNDRRRFLWLRNNLATILSQLVNAVLYTVFAFYGTYEFSTLCSIAASSFLIFVVTALLDTPVVYLSRIIYRRHWAKAGVTASAADETAKP